jgi:hypothetical protein
LISPAGRRVLALITPEWQPIDYGLIEWRSFQELLMNSLIEVSNWPRPMVRLTPTGRAARPSMNH